MNPRARTTPAVRAQGKAVTTDSPYLTSAIALLAEGLWPVAIHHPDTPVSKSVTDPSKQPIGRGWAETPPTEASLRAIWRKNPNAVVGLKLGVDGGIIDVEVDDPETGPGSYLSLMGGEDRPTRGFRSRHGPHRFFKYDSRLAAYVLAADAGVLKDKHLPGLPGIEIRIGAVEGRPAQTQSVVPPSPSTQKIDGQVAILSPREWNGVEGFAELPQACFDALDRVFAARAEPKAERPPALPRAGNKVAKGGGRLSFEERATLYALDPKTPPAVSGQGGHDRTFAVAVAVGPGFDLPRDAALRVMQKYNERCRPPWSAKELLHKVEDAYAKESRRGWLRDAGRDGRGEGKPRLTVQDPTADDDRRTGQVGPGRRPQIEINTERHLVVEETIKALANDPDIYQRGSFLVTVTQETADEIRLTPKTRLKGIAGSPPVRRGRLLLPHQERRVLPVTEG